MKYEEYESAWSPARLITFADFKVYVISWVC